MHRETSQSFRQAEEYAIDHAKSTSGQISGILEYLYRREDFEQAEIAISNMRSDANLGLSLLYDENNRVLLATRYELRNQPIDNTPAAHSIDVFSNVRKTLAGQVFLSEDQQHVWAVYPVVLGATPGELHPSNVGILFLEYDISATKQLALSNSLQRSLESTAELGLLCIIAWFFFDRTLTQRAARLVAASNGLTRGELNQRVQLKGSDELAQIAAAFDQMADRIQKDTEAMRSSEEQSRESEAAIRSLYEITAASELNLEQRLQQLVTMGCRYFNLDFGFLAHVEGDRYTLISAQAPDGSVAAGDVFELRQTYCMETLKGTEPLTIAHAKQAQWCQHPAYPKFGMESYIGMRVLVAGKIYGTLCFGSYLPRTKPFRAADRNLLKLMAQWCGGEIERQQVAIALQQQVEQATLLKQITEQIRQSLDAEQIFQTTAAQLGETFRVDRCILHTYIPGSNPRIPIMAEYREPGYESMMGLEIPVVGHLYVEQLLAQDRAIASSNIHTDPLLQSSISICIELMADQPEIASIQAELKSTLAVRTSYQGEPNGIIGIHHYSNYRNWTAEEIELLEAIADQVGIALEQARLLQQSTQQRKKLIEQNTALEKAKRTADSASRAKGDFLAMMSHEIRTPMNAVIGMTGLLLETRLVDQQRDFVETIRSSGDALLTIINDILDFSKIESGKLNLEEQPFSLRACVERALDLLSSHADEKGLELAYSINPSTPEIILGDASRLHQILLNLLSNAVKFTEAGGITVCVTSEQLEQESDADTILDFMSRYKIKFAVKDTGIGIPSDRMDCLFQSFSQVDASTTRQYGGTGLGLAISKRLSEMMGGSMWVESQVGVGSTFFFTLIAQSAPDLMSKDINISQRSLADEQLAQQLPLRILLAEDHVVNQKLSLLLLQRMGYRAEVASNGLEVLEALQRQHYDVVLMDVQMPEMDGLTAARHICKTYSTDVRPYIIAITANAMQGDRQLCLEAGMNDYITKPIRIDDLAQALRKCRPVAPARSSTPHLSTQILDLEHKQELALPVLDVSALEDLRDMAGADGSEFLVEIIDCYCEDTVKSMQTMQTAIAQADEMTLLRAAHSLKSTSASLGAFALAHVCEALERLGKESILMGETYLPRIELEYEKVQAALRVERQRYKNMD